MTPYQYFQIKQERKTRTHAYERVLLRIIVVVYLTFLGIVAVHYWG